MVAPAPEPGALHAAVTDWKTLSCADASVANTTSPATASTVAIPPMKIRRTALSLEPPPRAARRMFLSVVARRIPPDPPVVAKCRPEGAGWDACKQPIAIPPQLCSRPGQPPPISDVFREPPRPGPECKVNQGLVWG